jgi:hypothetical protein
MRTLVDGGAEDALGRERRRLRSRRRRLPGQRVLDAQSAYAASIGLAIGSFATAHGSVATVIAGQLAGSRAPSLPARRLAPLATAATLAAVLVLWLTR